MISPVPKEALYGYGAVIMTAPVTKETILGHGMS